MDPYISIGKESIEKESEWIDLFLSFLETNEREIMDQLSPLGNSLKNKKEESHGDSVNIPFQK